jgi:hypothetical protein
MSDQKNQRLPYTTNLFYDLGLLSATRELILDDDKIEIERLLEAVSAASDTLYLAGKCPRRSCRRTMRCQPESGGGDVPLCLARVPPYWLPMVHCCLLFGSRGGAYRDAVAEGRPVEPLEVDAAQVMQFLPRPEDIILRTIAAEEACAAKHAKRPSRRRRPGK